MKNNKKNDSEKSVNGFTKEKLEFQMDYLHNKSYAFEIIDQCLKTEVEDYCKFGNVCINEKKETIPMYYHELNTQKIDLDLYALEMDFEDWKENLMNTLNDFGAKDGIIARICYLGGDEDKPCLCITNADLYNEYMQKAS